METAKRQTRLNVPATKHELLVVLASSERDNHIENLDANLDQILKDSLVGENLHNNRNEESLLPEDIYNTVISQLAGHDHIEVIALPGGGLVPGNPETGTVNHEVDTIVRAYAGFPAKENPDGKEIIARSGLLL